MKSPTLNGWVTRSITAAMKFTTKVVDEKAMTPEITMPIRPRIWLRVDSVTGDRAMAVMMITRVSNSSISWRGNRASLPLLRLR